MVTVHGRVRATVRLRQSEVGAPCVVATSWASDRVFPRTVGVGVTFEIETADGEIFRVDPFQAMVALPVRRREREGGVSREYAWLAPADEITVDGELDPRDPDSAPPALHARRIALPAARAADVHRVPPRSLRSGEPDELHAEPEASAAAAAASPVESHGEMAAAAASPAESNGETAAATAPPVESNGASGGPHRRRKGKKPGSEPGGSGTPPPTTEQ